MKGQKICYNILIEERSYSDAYMEQHNLTERNEIVNIELVEGAQDKVNKWKKIKQARNKKYYSLEESQREAFWER